MWKFSGDINEVLSPTLDFKNMASSLTILLLLLQIFACPLEMSQSKAVVTPTTLYKAQNSYNYAIDLEL